MVDGGSRGNLDFYLVACGQLVQGIELSEKSACRCMSKIDVDVKFCHFSSLTSPI